jgi:hypothetical protein
MKSLAIIIIVVLVGLAGCNTNKNETKVLPGQTDQVSLHDDTNRLVARQTILYSDPVLYVEINYKIFLTPIIL